MECKKCNIEVPAAFEYALSKNMCPKCGSKLMADLAMKTYIDIKNRLNEVEFVMDKAMVCERIALFMVSNYDIRGLQEKVAVATEELPLPKKELSIEEIRKQEAARASRLLPREIGDLDPPIDLEDDSGDVTFDEDVGDEEVISGINESRVERLKKLASNSGAKTGTMVSRIG